jgi:hypothetical protein
MSEGAASEPAGKPAATLPFADALMEVVKSLHKDPVLVYGIGAGIILVGVLAFTASLALVLVVAGVLVAVLIGRILAGAQAMRRGGVFASALAVGGHYDTLRAANVKARSAPSGGVRTSARVIGGRAKKAELGNIELGGPEEPKGT